MDIAEIRADLLAEQEALDNLVSPLRDEQWPRATPSPGWSIADQIAHLAYFDQSASLAIAAPDVFARQVARLLEKTQAGDKTIDDVTLDEFRELAPEALLARWRQARAGLAEAAAGLGDDTRVPWYGPSMGAKSFLTARLMETWAHGQDIADTLGVERTPTDRLRHIAQLGYITRAWSYQVRGEQVPRAPVRLELAAPSVGTWTFGPEEAGESVTGPALDFCLVVVQRRHLDDTALVATPLARDWLTKAQAFAGPPTTGPPPAGDGHV